MSISARQKAIIVAALIERDNEELTPYLCRELERVIAGDAAGANVLCRRLDPRKNKRPAHIAPALAVSGGPCWT